MVYNMAKNMQIPKTQTSSKWPTSTPAENSWARTASTTPVQLHTPRTPVQSSRTNDSQNSTPRILPHTTTPQSVKTASSHVNQPPYLSGSRSASSASRQCNTPFTRKLKQGYDPQKADNGMAHLGLHRTRLAKDFDEGKRDEDGKMKTNMKRILSSTSLNVPTPHRTGVIQKRLSEDNKAVTPHRSSLGRGGVGSSKRSLGSATPTPQRARTHNQRQSGHSYAPMGGSVYVTPDVIASSPKGFSSSPLADHQHGKAESTKVSVGVRVRPFSSREESSSNLKSIIDVQGNSVRVTSENGTTHSFSFDHCFWSCDENHPHFASQYCVYSLLARPLLEKAYEGYNTCLFAYGQTGSGKSYTMLGEDCLEEMESGMAASAGIIPRFCQELFDKVQKINAQNRPNNQLPQCHVEVEVSYIEIYNERIYDLLGSGGERREALRVREHPDTGPYVEGVSSHLVSSYQSLKSWLLLGNKERSIAATGLNEKSSRSHAVFTIKLTQMQVEDVEGEQLESSRLSVVNLVDLAGSERVAAFQSDGDRLKEGVCINKSLFTLGKVITALAESEGHRRPFIPYRESVLTYLLKESLGGNSRTAMIATVSPSSMHVEETLSTLRYAQQARKIVNHNYINEDPTALIIRALKEEVERLRLQQVQKSPSLLFEGEDTVDDNLQDQNDEAVQDAVSAKESALLEKEMEMQRIIKEKEEEIAALRDQVQYHKLLSDKSKSLEQRLKETETHHQQALESLHRLGVANKNEMGPVLINLNEDPQLSETLCYRLESGTTTIGHSHCDLSLHGLHTEHVHCSISNDKGHLKLYPRAGADTFVNGKQISSPQKLHHNDRLVLAGLYYFRVSCPANPSFTTSLSQTKKLDFYFTRDELLRVQERRLQKEAELAVAASKAEMEQEMQNRMQQLMDNINEAKNQLVDQQDIVDKLQDNQWKLEEEKRLLEEQIKKAQQNSKSMSPPLPAPAPPRSNFLREIESIFNESVQEVKREPVKTAAPMLSFQLKEANQICKKLGKSFEFMMQQILSESGMGVVILVKDHHHQMTATLTLPAFAQKLQILRDIVQGEESEDEVFESGLVWERSEDMTCVPGFINRLLECPAIHNLNASFNFSLNTSVLGIRPTSTKRTSSIVPPSNKPENMTSNSAAVAATIHQVLENLPAFNPYSPIISTALSVVADLSGTAEIIRHHITEPGYILSEEDLSRTLVQLLCESQTVGRSILTLIASEAVKDIKNSEQLDEKLHRATTKLTSFISRIYQGVKTDVESLVEEASGMLIAITHTIIFDIAKLAVMTDFSVPDFHNLKPGGVMHMKFCDGLRSGLDVLMNNCCKTAETSKELMEASVTESLDQQTLLAVAVTTTSDIAAFLKTYSRLSATLEFSENESEEEQRQKFIRWMNQVDSAVRSVCNLERAFTDVANQVTPPVKGQLRKGVFEKFARDVIKELQQLMSCADVCSGLAQRTKDSCFMPELESRHDLVRNSTSVGKQALLSVEKLQKLVTSGKTLDNSSSAKKVIRYNKKVLIDWPTNSNEYQKYLKDISEQRKQQMKSSLRTPCENLGMSIEEKRVRFEFNSTASASDCLEDSVDD